MSTSRFYFRILPALLLLFILVTAVYAFAAANTVPVSGAGDGSNDISGYTVGAVSYSLNTTDPSTLDSVSFTLTPNATVNGTPDAPTDVQVQLNGAGTWYSCTESSGTWTCSLSGASVLTATDLRVVAAQ